MLRLTRSCGLAKMAMLAMLAMLTMLTTLTVLVPLTAVAGDGKSPVCASTQATIELRSCGYCREIKDILSDPDFAGVRFEVIPLRLGATVQISADTDEARVLMQEFVALMWGDGGAAYKDHACDYCSSRREHMTGLLVDWSSTSDGMELVLISEDPVLAQWALADARSTRGWVLGSASD